MVNVPISQYCATEATSVKKKQQPEMFKSKIEFIILRYLLQLLIRLMLSQVGWKVHKAVGNGCLLSKC